MFDVKTISGSVRTVYDVRSNIISGRTEFLIFDGNNWVWEPADCYVPC